MKRRFERPHERRNCTTLDGSHSPFYDDDVHCNWCGRKMVVSEKPLREGEEPYRSPEELTVEEIRHSYRESDLNRTGMSLVDQLGECAICGQPLEACEC